jgi:hypothetical protein
MGVLTVNIVQALFSLNMQVRRDETMFKPERKKNRPIETTRGQQELQEIGRNCTKFQLSY